MKKDKLISVQMENYSGNRCIAFHRHNKTRIYRHVSLPSWWRSLDTSLWTAKVSKEPDKGRDFQFYF